MNSFLMLVIVPLGNEEKIIKAANDAGAFDATILRARGADKSVHEGLFNIKLEPEEQIILISATKEIINVISSKIHAELEKCNLRSGSVYILPLQQGEE